MGRVIRSVALNIALAGALAACSNDGNRLRPAPDAAARIDTSSTTTPSETPSAPPETSDPQPDPRPAPSASEGETAMGAGEPAARGSSGSMPLAVSTAPGCARPGDTVTVQIATAPDVTFMATAVYGNGETYDTWSFGKSDAQGAATWRFTVAAAAPEGDASVMVSSGEASGARSGVGWAPFTVSLSC